MGQIKATVLYAKNGVITEDRFQTMTDIQWLFHYFEVMKMKVEDENERRKFEMSLDDNLSDLILITGIANTSDQKSRTALQKIWKELHKRPGELTDEEAEAVEELKNFPEEISVRVIGEDAKPSWVEKDAVKKWLPRFTEYENYQEMSGEKNEAGESDRV